MTWPGQVVHMIRKDLPRARWLIFGWAALVALLTLQIVVPAVRTGIPGVAGTLLLFVLGAGFAAWLVQGDAPHRQGAHWPGLPLAPSAVLAGKVFLAFGVGVGIPLAGQLATLIAFPVAAPDLPWLLARSSVSMGAGVTLGLVLGSVTDSVGKAAALLMGAILGVGASLTAFFFIFPHLEAAADPNVQSAGRTLVLGPLGVAASATFLLVLYRRGRVSRVSWGIAAVLANGCIGAAFLTSTATAPNPEGPTLGHWDSNASTVSAERVEVLELQLGDPESMPAPSDGTHRIVMLEVRIPGSEASEVDPQVRTRLEPTSFRLVNAEGEADEIRRAFQWDDAFLPEPTVGHPRVALPMTRPDGEGLLSGELHVEVRGSLVTRRLRLAPPLALVPGETHAAPGLRVTLLEPVGARFDSPEERGIRLRLERLMVGDDPHPPSPGLHPPSPLRNHVEIRFPTPSSPSLQIAGTSWGSGQARFLLSSVPTLNLTMESRPHLPVGGSGTVSLGIWEYVRSEPVVFRVPPERITVTTPGARGPS